MTLIIPLLIIIGVLAWMLRPGKNPTKPRRVSIAATAIASLVVAIVAVIFQVLQNTTGRTWVSDISNTCFIISLCLVGIAILATVGFVIARKWEIAKGIGFGICIGVLIVIIELAVLEWLAGV
jgi:Na+-transporting NADH:ubiquinone oxidoreductase subunit NqrE